MKEISLTEGSIFQKLVRFSLPMIAGNLVLASELRFTVRCKSTPRTRFLLPDSVCCSSSAPTASDFYL